MSLPGKKFTGKFYSPELTSSHCFLGKPSFGEICSLMRFVIKFYHGPGNSLSPRQRKLVSFTVTWLSSVFTPSGPVVDLKEKVST